MMEILATGLFCHPYWSKKILEAEPCRPHASNIFECSEHPKRPNEIDPRNLPAINLEVPPMTPEEEKKAELVKLAAKVANILADHNIPVEERLELAKKELKE